jgi:nucleoside 2-deoxyribosyltransferase
MSKKTENKIYLAGPLFTVPEKEWNALLACELKLKGYKPFLPQDECCGTNEEIFSKCVSGIDSRDIVLANVDGTDADSGTCFELGYAYGKNKRIICYRTDFRKCGDDGFVNLMLSKSCDEFWIVDSIYDLVETFCALV